MNRSEALTQLKNRNLVGVDECFRVLSAPIPLLLYCPICSERHIDVGEFAVKPHHTHACQDCGHVWRPAIEPTIGVRHLPGFLNPPSPVCVREAQSIAAPSANPSERELEESLEALVRAKVRFNLLNNICNFSDQLRNTSAFFQKTQEAHSQLNEANDRFARACAGASTHP